MTHSPVATIGNNCGPIMTLDDAYLEATLARERKSERERCALHLEELARKYSEQVAREGTDVAKGMLCGAQSIRDFLHDPEEFE